MFTTLIKYLTQSLGILVFTGWITLGNAQIQTSPFELTGGVETWQYQNESLGMMRLGLREQFNHGLSLGVESYTAMTGERGGFITLGLTGGYDHWFHPQWAIESGVFVGGGGGRGGYELAGGGLMIRQHIGLRHAYSKDWYWSAGISRVDFPEGGRIQSQQLYLGIHIPFTALTEESQRRPQRHYFAQNDWPLATHYSHQFSIKIRDLDVADGVKTDTGLAQANFGTIGAEWRTYLNDQFFIKLDTAGAYQGQSSGFMYILGGAGYRYTLNPRWSVYSSIATGGGGGGAVNTGGGWLFDADLGLEYQLARHWSFNTSISRLWASSQDFRAQSVNLQLAYLFGPETRTGHTTSSIDHLMSHPIRIRIAHQHYQNGSDNWRTRTEQDVNNLGAQLDYFIEPNIYLTGQGLGAYAGDAGAYMIGLIGLGLRQTIGHKLFTELEVLAGAAGGGGLNTGSGMVLQTNFSIGYEMNQALEVSASLGHLQSPQGDFKTQVIGLSLGYKFNILGAR